MAILYGREKKDSQKQTIRKNEATRNASKKELVPVHHCLRRHHSLPADSIADSWLRIISVRPPYNRYSPSRAKNRVVRGQPRSLALSLIRNES